MSSTTTKTQVTAKQVGVAVTVAAAVGVIFWGAHKVYKSLWLKKLVAVVETVPTPTVELN